MLKQLKERMIRFDRYLNLTKAEARAVYPAMIGLSLIVIQILATWLLGLDALYIGFIGFILLFIGSLRANMHKES